MSSADARIAVIGGGLAGSLLALALSQKGMKVDIFERRSDPRQQRSSAGRSINLGLSTRGLAALKSVGLLEDCLARCVAMRGRMIHVSDGSTRYQPYGKDDTEVLYSIDRNELNRLLLEKAEELDGVRLHFGHRLVDVNKERREITFESDGNMVKAQPWWLVGADGAFSASRAMLQRGMRSDYHQEYLEWGYKELTLEPNADGRSAIELSALHVWPRRHCLIVSHPNRNGSHTLTMFLPFEGDDSLASTRSSADVTQLFQKYFPDLLPLLPRLLDDWFAHAAGSLITTRTTPWAFGDWAVLVGDACHAVYPFYGQGMNSAFEDCCVLMRALEESPRDLQRAFLRYEHARRVHTDVLAELSKENFHELRYRVQSPWFVARKRLDVLLNRIWPTIWLPLYTMISHSTIPYADALARARQQDRIVRRSAIGVLAIACSVALLIIGKRL